jgi:thiol-disulfide isomerase/thioredoxin
MRTRLPALALFALAVGAFSDEPPAKEEARPYKIGDQVRLHTHKDLNGGPEIDLAKALEASRKGLVIVWYSPVCPACVARIGEISEFAKKYGEKGWTFVGVFSGMNGRVDALSPEEHAAYYKKQKVPFPVLDDREQRYKKPFGLKKTPQFAAITKDGKLGFLGAPWNVRDPKEQYLGPWLDAVAEGKEPPTFPAEKLVPWG